MLNGIKGGLTKNANRKSYIAFILENTPPNIEEKLGLDFNVLTTGDIETARIGQLIHGVRYGFYDEALPVMFIG